MRRNTFSHPVTVGSWSLSDRRARARRAWLVLRQRHCNRVIAGGEIAPRRCGDPVRRSHCAQPVVGLAKDVPDWVRGCVAVSGGRIRTWGRRLFISAVTSLVAMGALPEETDAMNDSLTETPSIPLAQAP